MERSRSTTKHMPKFSMDKCTLETAGESAVHSCSNHGVLSISVLVIPFSSLCQDSRCLVEDLILLTVNPKYLKE